MWSVWSQVAAVEIDRVHAEAAPERRRQGASAFAEAQRTVKACEREVRMVGTLFRDEAAASHAADDLRLKMQESAGRVDLGDKDTGPWKNVQVGESDRERREVKFFQLILDRGQPLFGDFAKKNKCKVIVLWRGPTGFCKRYRSRVGCEGVC